MLCDSAEHWLWLFERPQDYKSLRSSSFLTLETATDKTNSAQGSLESLSSLMSFNLCWLKTPHANEHLVIWSKVSEQTSSCPWAVLSQNTSELTSIAVFRLTMQVVKVVHHENSEVHQCRDKKKMTANISKVLKICQQYEKHSYKLHDREHWHKKL